MASMGPQLDSCGRCIFRTSAKRERVPLQWGRNLTVAEGNTCATVRAKGAGLQWGRNLTVAEGWPARSHRYSFACASMGPQLDSCGRLVDLGMFVPHPLMLQWGRNLTVAEGGFSAQSWTRRLLLQWGRNLTVAEGKSSTSTSTTRKRLQWGRNLTVAEGLKSRRRPPPPHNGFNGAAT